MPWDGTELYIAAVSISGDSISISTPQLIAGHKSTEAISQPNWISNESLVFLTDKSDFNNPWRFDIGKPRPTPILPKPINEEFGEVMKRIADSSTAVLSPDKVVYAITRESRNVLYLLDTNTGSVDEIETPFTEIVAVHGVDAERICFIGTKYDDGPMVVEGVILPRIHGQELPHNVLKKTSNTISTLPPALISKSQAITFKASDGSPLHILYHPPANPKYKAPSNEKPPAVVNVHGGPVRRVAPGFLWMTQYFTSRGFAWWVFWSAHTTLI
jgi:dipeptidyl aminopeptidase/acylaminoacyl peptidase